MKKYYFLIMSITFVLLFSCSSQKSIQISYLQIWSDNLNSTFETICQDWAKKNNVNIVLESVALKDLDLKTATMIESETGPDLAIFPSHQIIIYKDKLADFSDVAAKLINNYSKFYNVPTEMNKIDNTWYGIPLYSWSHIWVLRKDLLEACNVKAPQTYDEVLDVCQSLSNKYTDIYPIGIGLGKDDDAAMFFQATLWAFGGKVTEEDGTTIALNSVNTKQALNYIINLYNKKYLPPGVLGWDGASNNKNFLAEEIAITINSPTIYYAAKRDKPDLYKNIIHTMYPSGPNGRFSYATGFTLSALKNNKNLNLIKNLIEYIFEYENYSKLIIAGEGSVNPSINGFEELDIWQDPNLKASLESVNIEKSVGYPGPLTKPAAIVFQRRILTDMFGRIINDNLSVDKAINEAETIIKNIYAEYK